MSFEPKQIEMICLEDLILENHIYRKFLSWWNLDLVQRELEKLEAESDYKGYGIFRIFLCLLFCSFLKDLSDRELERFIAENTAAKLFCDFSLISQTPDHSLFKRLRQSIGTNNLASIFNSVREQLKQKGLVREIFTFVDSSQLISKIHLWNERDKAIAKGSVYQG